MGDATLCGVMEFDRRLDPGRLGSAAAACIRAHPILHSRLVTGQGPAFWERADHVRPPPVVPEACSGNYHPLVIGPVDPAGPLQCRVRLLRLPAGDIIVINLSHAAADAFGLHTLMAQLLQEYRVPGTIRPAEGGIPARDTLWAAGRAAPLPAPWERDVVNPMWPDPFGRSDAPMTFHRICVSRAELAAVRAYAASAGGSVNDAIVAAYFLAAGDLTGCRDTVEVFFPVNLRQHRRDGSRAMSNQSGNVSFPLRREDGEGMASVLPRVIGHTRGLKLRGIGLAEQEAMDRACDPEGREVHRMVAGLEAFQREGYADIFLSNPGTFALPDLEGLTDAYVCYPGGLMPTTCLMTSTFRGQMTITLGFQDSERPREAARRLLELFRKHLIPNVLHETTAGRT
jgi:NRPS condensation-like uncharacterized protein